MSMTRSGIIENRVMPSGERAMAPGVAELLDAHHFERETRARVTYAAYSVPFGDAKALVAAQHKQPSLVRVRVHGRLELFGIDLAIVAIQNGGTLEV